MKSPITKPSTPTSMRIRPAVCIEMPATVAVTANFNTAPTAIRNMDVPIVMTSGFPRRSGANLRGPGISVPRPSARNPLHSSDLYSAGLRRTGAGSYPIKSVGDDGGRPASGQSGRPEGMLLTLREPRMGNPDPALAGPAPRHPSLLLGAPKYRQGCREPPPIFP